MDRIADSGSADGGSNPSGHTKKPVIVEITGFFFNKHLIKPNFYQHLRFRKLYE